MPIFEYRCERCDILFDRIEDFQADYPDCPVCKSEVYRIFSPDSHMYRMSKIYSKNEPRSVADASD